MYKKHRNSSFYQENDIQTFLKGNVFWGCVFPVSIINSNINFASNTKQIYHHKTFVLTPDVFMVSFFVNFEYISHTVLTSFDSEQANVGWEVKYRKEANFPAEIRILIQ